VSLECRQLLAKAKSDILWFMSSLAEIRQAIEKLAPKERAELRQWLDAQDIEESPEFLSAVDKGIWSAENEPKSSLEDVMKRLEERFGWKLN
jgi:hypothetical protein